VNTEINFWINGRCGVNGQLSKHFNLKDYGLKQFFGEEKKFIPHNVNCLCTPITSSSSPSVQIFPSALNYSTQISSGVVITVYVQKITQLQVQ